MLCFKASGFLNKGVSTASSSAVESLYTRGARYLYVDRVLLTFA